MSGVEDYCRRLENEFNRQRSIMNFFLNSPALESVKRLLDGEKVSGVTEIGSASRNIYFCELESKSHTLENRFYVKVPKPATNFENVLFDAYFLVNTRIREDVVVPDYAFVVRSGIKHAIVVKDVSNGFETIPLNEAYAERFSNSREYSNAEENYCWRLKKVLWAASLNPQKMTDNCLSLDIYPDLKTTGVVLHNKEEFEQIACVGTDQLFPFLRDVLELEKVKGLENLVVNI